MWSNYISGIYKELCFVKCNYYGYFFWKQQLMWSKYISGVYKELYFLENNLVCSDKFNFLDNYKIILSGKFYNW